MSAPALLYALYDSDVHGVEEVVAVLSTCSVQGPRVMAPAAHAPACAWALAVCA